MESRFPGTYLRTYHDTVSLITGKKALDNHFKKWKLDIIFDARQTLISNTRARLGGFRLGVEHRRVHRFGIAVYAFDDPVGVSTLREVSSEVDTAVLNMSYFSLFYERVYYFSRKWEFSAAVHVADGTIGGKYKLIGSPDFINYPEQRVRPVEFSTSGYYNITWWLSAGGGIGYRFMRNTPREVRPIYNAPVLIFKVKFRFFKILRRFGNPEVVNEY
ncbi:MAG: hypothetical protein JNM00_07885 [Flavobacteriales bacterium]|nr:hypothetical protein [Flavobacteriales bacterium]